MFYFTNCDVGCDVASLKVFSFTFKNSEKSFYCTCGFTSSHGKGRCTQEIFLKLCTSKAIWSQKKI